MASFKVYYDEEQKCLICSLEGKASPETVKKYAEKILETGDKHQCKSFFNDLRKAESGFSLTEVIETMSMMKGMGFDNSWKRAMVVAKDSQEYRFYEALILNEAINLKVFTNPHEAMIWLNKSD
jgi:hypothetical protein